MTTNKCKITDQQRVLDCEHSRLREALMAHSPVSAPLYRPVRAAIPVGPSLSKESKLYLALLSLAGVTVFCHTLISIISF